MGSGILFGEAKFFPRSMDVTQSLSFRLTYECALHLKRFLPASTETDFNASFTFVKIV